MSSAPKISSVGRILRPPAVHQLPRACVDTIEKCLGRLLFATNPCTDVKVYGSLCVV